MTLAERMADHLSGAAIIQDAQAILALVNAGFDVESVMAQLDTAMLIAFVREDIMRRSPRSAAAS